jgi:thiol-disulfide isomerase/thioredoxin
MKQILCLLAIILISSTAVAQHSVPEWNLPDVDGNETSFHSALSNGPVLVSYWALWCGPCLKELPHLNELAGEFADELTVIAINTDTSRSVHKVAPFLATRGYNKMTIVCDTSGDVQRKMQVPGALPYLVLYDSSGNEVYKHTGYREGDAIVLREEITSLLASDHSDEVSASGQLQVSHHLEYSYSKDLYMFAAENWIDVSYTANGFQYGALINSQQPSEEGIKDNSLLHEFVEYNAAKYSVRAGHFYGMFGRGLLFSAYENRAIRVDSVLEGAIASGNLYGLKATAFTGSPSALETDIEGVDFEYNLGKPLTAGFSRLSWDDEWARSGRLNGVIPHMSYYVEYGIKRNDSMEDYDDGKAFYAGLNLNYGSFGLSVEGKDYENFRILDRADGKVALNNGPSLTREHLYSLPNRYPLNQNMDDELGSQIELTWDGSNGWSALVNASRILSHGELELTDLFSDPTGDFGSQLKFEEFYAHLEKEKMGPFHWRTAYHYAESEGKNLYAGIGELIWHKSSTQSWTFKGEQQFVELSGNENYDLGSFNQQFMLIEYNQAPHWAISGIIELNDLHEEQLAFVQEKEGPFPAAQVSYVSDNGALFTLWAGQRQAGYLCAGGVCKIEPAFEGVELTATFKY